MTDVFLFDYSRCNESLVRRTPDSHVSVFMILSVYSLHLACLNQLRYF